MIYALSLVLGLYGLATGIPALRHLLRMRDINRNCAVTTGEARSVRRKLGAMLAWGIGEGKQFSVFYLSPTGKELVLEVIVSGFYLHPSYSGNQGVEVVYDKDSPGRAYTKPEWEMCLRELLFASLALIAAIALWGIGKAFNLPS